MAPQGNNIYLKLYFRPSDRIQICSHNSKSKASFVTSILDLNTLVWHTQGNIWHSYEPIHFLFWLIKLELNFNGELFFWNKGGNMFSLTPGRPTGTNMIMNLMCQSVSENISLERSYFFLCWLQRWTNWVYNFEYVVNFHPEMMN